MGAGPDFPGRRAGPSVARMAPIPTPSRRTPGQPGHLRRPRLPTGAERLARERGWSTVRSLPPGAIITMEYRAGRLNFEVKDGRVARAWKG